MFLALSKNGYFQSFLGRFVANISVCTYHTENREQRSKTQNRDAANIRSSKLVQALTLKVNVAL